MLLTRLLTIEGFSCECLELNVYSKLYKGGLLDIDPYALLIRFLKITQPLIVGISSMTPNLHLAKKLSRIVRDERPHSLIVLGGMATCDISRCFIDSSFDVVIQGEGENAFLQLVRGVINGEKGYDRIPGVHHKDTYGPHLTPHNIHYQYGQSTVLPAYDILPRELPLIPRLYLSRGCGNGCDFCSPADFFLGTVRTRQPHTLADDIKYAHSHFHFEWFLIGDLTFYLNSKSARKLLQLLGCMELKPWWAQTQLSYITEENTTLLKNAGCRQLAVGIEDFDTPYKTISRKNGGKERARQNLSLLKAMDISVQSYWMFGLPGETLLSSMKKIKDICELIRDGLIDTAHISYFVPYPNTRLVRNNGISMISDDFSPMLGPQSRYYSNTPMHRTRDLSEKEILLLTQLAISCSANEFSQRATQ